MFCVEVFGLLSLRAEKVTVVDGQPIALQWNAGPVHEGVRIHIELNINNHGSTGARIVCEVEDNGSANLPADLVSQLFAFGVSGFPSLVLTRQSADAADLRGSSAAHRRGVLPCARARPQRIPQPHARA